MNGRKGMGPDGNGGGEKIGGVREVEIVIRIRCIEKNILTKEKIKRIIHSYI